MRQRHSPTLRRRRLSAELRRLRAASRLTSAEVGKRLDWSPGKLTWIERAQWVRPNIRDVRDLLDLYEVTDERLREYLVQLAREGRKRGWWHPYRKMLSERYSTYIGLETEAETLLTWQPAVIPGLLQTDDYARALIRSGPAEIDTEEVERRVEVRAERQRKIVTGDDPVRLWAVIDEAALRRHAGGPEVMGEQLRRLVELAELPKVTVQVVPFDVGTHPGTAGAFTIMSFPEGDADGVYVEAISGELMIEDEDDVSRYQVAFRRLNALALSPRDTIAMITEVVRTQY